jgi:uncharacterized protein (TIGR02145 family)
MNLIRRVMRILHRCAKKNKANVIYGLLYNYYTAIDERKLTSSDGWVVPLYTDITALETYLGGSSVSGGKLKETGTTYWNSPNTGATNEVYFNGRGAGKRNSNGTFANFKTGHGLGTRIQYNTLNWYVRSVANSSNTSSSGLFDNKTAGWSIRLLKASTSLSNGESGTYTGNNGRIYKTICIGAQEWLAENLIETKFRNGEIIPWYGADPANYFTNAEWGALTTAGVCAYNNDLSLVAPNFSFPTS